MSSTGADGTKIEAGHFPTSSPGFVEACRRAWVSHPRWSLAVKGAIAASLAWFVGSLAPAPFSQYPYYAPLGAVIATTGTLVRSVRDSVQSVAAVLVGAVIARAVDLMPLPGPLEIAVVVGVTLLCVRWRLFGEMGDWAVMSAVFVLVLGDAVGYIVAYPGLIIVGASIGIGVNLLLPPLPLTPSERALDRLRDGLVDQVDALAGWLEEKGPLAVDEWERRRDQLSPTIEAARAAIAQSREASRANRRASRNRDWMASQTRRADVLQTEADVVDDIVRLLLDWEHDGRDEAALGRQLRPAFAATLRRLASALTSPETVARLDESIEELSEVVRRVRRSSREDLFVAGALIVTLQRAADALRTSR